MSSHSLSTMAEGRVNASTSSPGSTLERSAASRRAAEQQMSESEKEFDRKHQRNEKKLDKVTEELEQLDLTPLSEQVSEAPRPGTPVRRGPKVQPELADLPSPQACGGAAKGDGCPGSACGGLGCSGTDGAPTCGGEECDGFVTAAHAALKSAKGLDREIVAAMKEADKLFSTVRRSPRVQVQADTNAKITFACLFVLVKVWEAKKRANEAKANGMEVLVKSNRSRGRVEQSNQQLRSLIKEIRDLLTSEVSGSSQTALLFPQQPSVHLSDCDDPDERANVSVIEAVAGEVLALEMPTSVGKLRQLTGEIKEKVGALTSVETILSQSAEDVRAAEALLQEAMAARSQIGHFY